MTPLRSMLPLLLALTACGGPPVERSESAEPSSALVQVDTATIAVPLALPAQLYVEHDAAVYARASGIVESVFVDLGAPVRAGQRLAQLEQVDQALALAQADAAAAAALLTVRRTRALATTRAVTVADSEEAETAWRKAELTQRQAQRDLDLTRVVAPFAGVVTARWVRRGRLVATRDSLFRISALGPVLAAVRVPAEGAGSVTIGATGTILGADGQTATARVIRAAPILDAASGTREIVLQLAAGARFKPGESVAVRVGAERRRILAIPAAAVTEQGYVLVWEDGRPVLRAVTLGTTLSDGRIEVLTGLTPGERIIAQPAAAPGP